MGMCDPSIAPAHCGKPQLSSKPFTTAVRLSPDGMEIYRLKSCCTITVHTSLTIVQAVHLATPNKCPILLYSMLVARHHKVIATLRSMLSGVLITVVFLFSFLLTSLQRYLNVSGLSLKFSFHSFRENCGTTLCTVYLDMNGTAHTCPLPNDDDPLFRIPEGNLQ